MANKLIMMMMMMRVFPRLALVTCFSALGAGYVFFSALGVGYMFFRVLRW